MGVRILDFKKVVNSLPSLKDQLVCKVESGLNKQTIIIIGKIKRKIYF